MAKYTTEVRTICEHYADFSGKSGYDDVANVIETARAKIFDFSYPIFDTVYKSELETKILRHFYTREIGFETVGLWKLRLSVKMNEIMPYYNQLYKSEKLEINPLNTQSYTKTHKGTDSKDSDTNSAKSGADKIHADVSRGTTIQSKGSQKNNSSGTTTDTNLDLFSDTPQGSVSGLDNMDYLTNARKTNGSNTGNYEENSSVDNKSVNTGQENSNQVINYGENNSVTEKITSSDEFTDTFEGNSSGKSESKLLEEYRKTFLNIDMLVIGELEELFMQLW